MIKKYKVIKSWPKGLAVGTVVSDNGNGVYRVNDFLWFYKEHLESSPEFFAPLLFTTHNSVDIYDGDTYWLKCCDNRLIEMTKKACQYTYMDGAIIQGQLTFSTKEAAQQWIDSQKKPIWKTEDKEDVFDNDNVSWVICYGDGIWNYIYDLNLSENVTCVRDQPETYKVFKNKNKMNAWIEEMNKPQFQQGEWITIKLSSCDCIGRFVKQEGGLIYIKEEYNVFPHGVVECESKVWSTHNIITKASPQLIESILTAVAIHKGFKAGVQYQSATQSTEIFTSGNNFKWEFGDTLYSADSEGNLFTGCIYYKGVWAEIVENVPEYVKCVKSASEYYLMNNVYKVQQYGFMKGFVIGEGGSKITLHNHILLWPNVNSSIFTESNKAEYDAQFQTKEITITLDGDVVNTSHWGNNVKITYK